MFVAAGQRSRWATVLLAGACGGGASATTPSALEELYAGHEVKAQIAVGPSEKVIVLVEGIEP